MARLSKRDLDRIIERDLPGYRVAKRGKATPEHDAGAPNKSADQQGLEIETLQRKYLGENGIRNTARRRRRSSRASTDASPDEPEDEFVVVQPKDASDLWAPGARPKVVVVSGKDRKIVATQG